MPRPEPDLPVFEIGITLAGAISAGAFSAGALDHLLRAMDAHNRRAMAGGEDAPKHLVVVKVMSGASAGSVTLASAVAGLVNRAAPKLATCGHESYRTVDGGSAKAPFGLAEIHDIWVNQLALWHDTDEGAPDGLLSLSDLEKDAPLTSALDSTYIDRVADAVLEEVTWSLPEDRRYSFLASELDLFVMTTSLSSVPYAVSFAGSDTGISEFRMGNHRVVRHFRLKDAGWHDLPSPWLDAWSDHGIALRAGAEKDAPLFGEESGSWTALKDSVKASAAFPVGLAARRLDASAGDFGLINGAEGASGGAPILNVDPDAVDFALPDFGDEAERCTPVSFFAVDGGVLNNEPFEYARYTLRDTSPETGKFLKSNERCPRKADRAVILIDPFPAGPEYEPFRPADGAGLGLGGLLVKLNRALIAQARFKPSEFVNAADPTVASRFVLQPERRDTQGGTETGAKAISCGSLHGFGGFLARRFRAHDFILGQRNCAMFLQETFRLPADNPIFGRPDASGSRPIIDPGPELADPVPLPEWPRVTLADLEPILKQARKRLQVAGRHLIRGTGVTGPLAVAMRVGWFIRWPIHGISRRIEEAIVLSGLRELIRRNSIAEVANLSNTEQAILLELLSGKDR